MTPEGSSGMAQNEPTESPTAFQMPNVFVVPPEEDEVPVWCCFDAAVPTQEQTRHLQDQVPEVHLLELTSHTEEGVPIFQRSSRILDTVVMPGKDAETRSIVDTLMGREYNIDHFSADSDSDLDWDSENEEQPHTHEEPQPQPRGQPEYPPRTTRDAAEDSDVIEVVKVSRSKRGSEDSGQQAPPPFGIKRSATFKARASRAFRSLSGAFRNSKPRSQDILPSRPSSRASYQENQAADAHPQQTLPRPRSPAATVSRRLSQLFTAPSLKARGSVPSFDDPTEQGVIASPSEPVPPARMSISNPRTSVSYTSPPLSRRSSVYQDTLPLEQHPRAPSPNPSTSGKSTNRRFSKLNLQKLFSFSSQPSSQCEVVSQSPAPPVADGGRAKPTLKRKSSSLPSTSSESTTSGPQTPTSAEGIQPIHVVTTTHSIVDEAYSPPLDFDGFGEGLGIASQPQSQQEAPPKQSFSSYRSFSLSIDNSRHSHETASAKSLPSVAPQLDNLSLGLDNGDMSLEMRLDSLHFDSISFDADQFIVD